LTATTLTLSDRCLVLKRHFLFQDLSPWDLELVARHSRVLDIAEGAYVFRKNDPGTYMIIVLSGTILIGAKSAEGREAVFNIIGAGEIFGEVAFLDDLDRTADARALEDSRLLTLDRRQFKPLLEQNPKLSLGLLQIACRRIRETTAQVEETNFFRLSTRLARNLLVYAKKFGRPHDGGIEIDLNLSQGDLAAHLNATRESVNRQLRQWARLGLVSLESHRIVLRDVDRLTLISED